MEIMGAGRRGGRERCVCVLYDSRQIQIERLADERWPSKQPWKRFPGLAAHLWSSLSLGWCSASVGRGHRSTPEV